MLIYSLHNEIICVNLIALYSNCYGQVFPCQRNMSGEKISKVCSQSPIKVMSLVNASFQAFHLSIYSQQPLSLCSPRLTYTSNHKP